MSNARFIIGDTRDVTATIPDGSVDLIITSPPFLALRSYLPADHPDKHREIGSEATPAAFLDVLLDLTTEWRRVLAPHGSICVELGDTYSGSGGAGGDYGEGGLREGQPTFKANPGRSVRHQAEGHTRGISARAKQDELPKNGRGWPLAKSLCGIPHLYHLSLAYGRNLLNPEHTIEPWRVRNVVAWVRPNPPVGALCVDDQTEALTPDGWRRHSELVDGDLIASYDPRTDSCRFLPAKFVRYQRENEPMVVIDKKATTQWLTEDHRVWTRTRKLEPHVRLARDLTNDCDTLLCAPFDDVAGYPPVTTERAALLGWFIAEGSPHHRQSRIVQSLSANPEKVTRIRALLDFDGADYRESTYRRAGSEIVTFTIKGELAEWLNLHPKRLPMSYVTTWPEAQAQALFDALIDGDGHRRKNAEGVLFHQQDERVADGVQVLAIRLGYRASKHWQPTMRLWQITMSRALVKDRRWTRIRKWDGEGIRRETYTGIVWCPIVETSFWLARRDGQTFITGNSDKFRPATSYLTIACVSSKRYFDLDAVRGPASENTHARSAAPRYNLPSQQRDGNWSTLAQVNSDPGAGAPPLDWWEIPTAPYQGAHYAAFPKALITRPILAMCPIKVCTVCGKPSERITSEVEYVTARNGKPMQKIEWESGLLNRRHITGADNGGLRSTTTVGWTDCGHNAWRSGHILDPFAGSGTTGAVATGMGRDCTLIDLDPRNADLARDRVGMFLEVEDHTGTPAA